MDVGAWLWSQVVDPHWASVCVGVAAVVAAALAVLMRSFPSEAMAFAWFTWPVTAYWALRADHGWAWWLLVPLPLWMAVVLLMFLAYGACLAVVALRERWRTRGA